MTTRELIERAVELMDDRAMAAFAIPEPENREERPDRVLVTTGADELVRLLVSGTDLDADELEHYVEAVAHREVLDIGQCPRALVITIFESFIRTAFLTGYHVRRLQEAGDD